MKDEPAFPQSKDWQDDMERHDASPEKCGQPSMFGTGMTLRDYFAAKAMQSYWADPESRGTLDEAALWAYKQADAMLRARDETSGD